MVRAIRLEQSASGTYYNLSEGIIGLTDAVNAMHESATSQATRIFPNPSAEAVTIFNDGRSGYDELMILDAEGKIIFRKNKIGFPETVDISSFPCGIYSLLLYGKERPEVKKLVVIR